MIYDCIQKTSTTSRRPQSRISMGWIGNIVVTLECHDQPYPFLNLALGKS